MEKRTKDISAEEVAEKIKKLDTKDLVLVNNGVQLLLARNELDKKEQAPA